MKGSSLVLPAFLLVSSLFLLSLASSISAAKGTVLPGVHFTYGNTTIVWQTTTDFTTLQVLSDRVMFDAAYFSAVPSFGNLSIRMHVWNPSGLRDVVLRWTAVYAVGAQVTFKIGGLQWCGYVLWVDGLEQAQLDTPGGNASFAYSDGSEHTFQLQPSEDRGLVIPSLTISILIVIAVGIMAAVALRREKRFAKMLMIILAIMIVALIPVFLLTSRLCT